MSIEAHSTKTAVVTKQLVVLILVLLWTIPTVGLLVSSVRDKDQLSVSGWWSALTSSESQEVHRLPKQDAQTASDGNYLITDEIFDDASKAKLSTWGPTAKTLSDFSAGESMLMDDGSELTVNADGSVQWTNDQSFEQFDPALTANFIWYENLSSYAKVSTGYKAGGSSEGSAPGMFGETFDPEEVITYELGLKSEWLDRSLRANIALF